MKYSINFDSTDIEDVRKAQLIKEAGFDSAFIWWSRTDDKNKDRAFAVRNAGLDIETAHTDFNGINNMWLDNAEGREHFDYYMRAVHDAKALGIPVLIIHLSSGNTPPPINELGLDRFKKIVACAEDNGIILAFENLRIVAYLDAMLAATSSPSARFCFDIGHENIYNGSRDILEKHGDRLAAFHLHDNHGTSDEHLLPFDGSIDWQTAASRIKPYLDKVPFTVEAYAADVYNPETFYSLAMERAKRVTDLM